MIGIKLFSYLLGSGSIFSVSVSSYCVVGTVFLAMLSSSLFLVLCVVCISSSHAVVVSICRCVLGPELVIFGFVPCCSSVSVLLVYFDVARLVIMLDLGLPCSICLVPGIWYLYSDCVTCVVWFFVLVFVWLLYRFLSCINFLSCLLLLFVCDSLFVCVVCIVCLVLFLPAKSLVVGARLLGS